MRVYIDVTDGWLIQRSLPLFDFLALRLSHFIDAFQFADHHRYPFPSRCVGIRETKAEQSGKRATKVVITVEFKRITLRTFI
ncbi:hypothetical protein [Paraburkholderia atlantica]|uniref:hypothetical protein n=1 Tax=Paraburkholderia atlantica TaxID=2654982 RepID=UPI001C84ED04|nr:hypothetical protein [Paraburkholderia atlantica]